MGEVVRFGPVVHSAAALPAAGSRLVSATMLSARGRRSSDDALIDRLVRGKSAKAAKAETMAAERKRLAAEAAALAAAAAEDERQCVAGVERCRYHARALILLCTSARARSRTDMPC